MYIGFLVSIDNLCEISGTLEHVFSSNLNVRLVVIQTGFASCILVFVFFFELHADLHCCIALLVTVSYKLVLPVVGLGTSMSSS